MKTYIHIPIIIMFALLLYGIGVTVVDWLSLPVVAVNYDYECQWVQVPTRYGVERLECPEILPDSYDRIFVSTNKININEW